MIVKICGITSLDDARSASNDGADLLGFVFYTDSPRYMSPVAVKEIIRKLPSEQMTVGVFVNETNVKMLEIAQFCGLNILQLHGGETLDQVKGLENTEIIKAIPVRTEADLQTLEIFTGYTVIIDTPSEKFGGTGEVGDWRLAREAAKRAKIFLAGGLTPDNVGEAITAVTPYGVDVSSGVEKEKGIKDPEKVKRFIAAAKRIGQ